MHQKQVNIFWTGGWDSTYRMIELSILEVNVQPIYVVDPERGSVKFELSAMEKILLALNERTETKASFLPILMIDLKDITQDEGVSKAYMHIRESVKLGSQYEWLGWLALQYPGVEIGIEKPYGEFSGCITAIEKFGKFKYDEDAMIVDQDASSDECNKLFGNMRFPIADKTEKEMIENIKNWGYEDVMKNLWFCHAPIKEQPCGMCRPCQQKMECGMEFLLPQKAQKRYRIFSKIKNLFGENAANITKRICRRLI